MYMLSATCIQLPCRNALVSSRHGCPVSVYGAKFAPQSSSSGFDRSPYDAARHISTNIAILTTASTIVSHGLDVGCSLMGSWYGLSRVSRARAIIFGVPDTAGRVTEREQRRPLQASGRESQSRRCHTNYAPSISAGADRGQRSDFDNDIARCAMRLRAATSDANRP
jgi:hypothetical protein